MKRASFVRLAAGVAGTGATIGVLHGTASAVQPVRRLVPVDVSLDRVTRTTVGLRPYRSAGFVLRAEAHDSKTLVHNYGHGGGGMSLAWGTAIMATELALQTQKRTVAVLGCGVIGLSTARVLQDSGFDVTIYARDIPPNTTSNTSGAQWTPSELYDDSVASSDFRAQYVRAATIAYGRYQMLLGEDFGVRWIENYDCHDGPSSPFLSAPDTRVISQLYPEVVTYGPGQHPFPKKYATRFLTMLIEPNRYLRALLRDYFARGSRIVVQSFSDITQVLALGEPLIVNCTGLGSKALLGDSQLEPVRGQLSVLAPQPGIDYIALYPARYMFPRSDGVVLGGTFEHGATSLDPDPSTMRNVVADHAAFFQAMQR